MIRLVQEHLDTSIAILTLVVSSLVIFLGLGDDTKNKQEQLKFVLISYSVIFFIILFFLEVPAYIFGILILFFILGGLSYSINKDFGLERELHILQLLFYSSFSWFFITNNYFLFFSVLIIYMLKIPYSIALILITISLISQYLSIVKDYFGVNAYNNTLEKLNKINLYAKNDKQAKDIVEDAFSGEKLQLVAFALYVEDRHLFDRKKYHISFNDLFKSISDPVIFKGKIIYEQKSWISKYKRGYSTIEQQLIRQYAIGEHSYRYKYRRKIFFDWIYTPLFSKAICNRKSRVYGGNKKNAKEELIWHLKVMYLYNYFIIVLKNPTNKNELLTNMSKQSRVSRDVYEKMFEIFENSSKKDEMEKKIQRNLKRKYNFY